jgi:hypothetical protein
MINDNNVASNLCEEVMMTNFLYPQLYEGKKKYKND